jgi:Protein of unknown function (DUF3105)
VSSRKEQKEALRREREQREQEAKAAQARKRMVGYGGAGVLVIAVLAVLALVLSGSDDAGGVDKDVLPDGGSVPEQKEFDLETAAAAAGCELEDVEASGNFDHTTDPSERVKYNSNPPTSGRHFAVPAEDGAYSTAPSDEELVHNLEHGRVIVWVKPDLPVAQREQIRALFDEDDYQMIVVQRANMPYAVAATAWNADPTPLGTGQLMGCPQWNDDVIDALRTFRDEHRSNGPEPIP